MTWSVEAIAAFDLQSVKQRLQAAGLRCVGLYSPAWGGRDEDDVHQRAQAIARAAHLAEMLGADRVVTTGATSRQEGKLANVTECVRRVLGLLPPSNRVKLVLENHFGNVLQEPEDFRQVLEAVDDPRVGICVDTGHFHSAHVDTVAFIHCFAPRIYAVHLKDHIGTTSVGIGRGEIDLPAIIAALRAVKYHGDLTIELEVSDPENLPRYAQEAYVYVCGLLGKKL